MLSCCLCVLKDSKCFLVIVTLGRSQRSQAPDPVTKVCGDTASCFYELPFVLKELGGSSQSIVDLTWKRPSATQYSELYKFKQKIVGNPCGVNGRLGTVQTTEHGLTSQLWNRSLLQFLFTQKPCCPSSNVSQSQGRALSPPPPSPHPAARHSQRRTGVPTWPVPGGRQGSQSETGGLTSRVPAVPSRV